jgi:WD40 repeat protein
LIASGGRDGASRYGTADRTSQLGSHSNTDGSVTSVCFSPDSRWLVSGSWDKSVRMWDCRTGQAIGSPLLGHTSSIRSVCTDGHRIISGSDDGTIRIWSCDTRQLIGAPINAGHYVWAVALSKDGRIAAGVDHDVCIFDIETRRQISSMKGHTGRCVDSCLCT